MNELSKKYLEGNPFNDEAVLNTCSALGIESIGKSKFEHLPKPILNSLFQFFGDQSDPF